MSSDVSGLNPFKRGKSVILSNLILEGKTNREIVDYYLTMGFDKKYGALNKDQLYSIRSDLKKVGLLNEAGLPVKSQVDALPKSGEPTKTDDTGGAEEPMFLPVDLEKRGDEPTITRRPDWDILSSDQINSIADPKLRMEILNYKTEIDRLRQELKPEYATRGEIDLLRTEVVSRFGGVEEKINTLLSKFDEPEPEDESGDEEEEPEPEEAEVEAPKKMLKLTSKVNPLEAEGEAQEQEDEIIEVEGSIVARKSIGLTAKSMMLYDLAKTQGFPGNLADFVNSCISDAYKGRSIELAVIDKKVIR